MRISASVVGFMGYSRRCEGSRAGSKRLGNADRTSDRMEQRPHVFLARVGPRATLVLVACDDQDTKQAAVAKTADQAIESWDGSRTELVDDLDQGPKTIGFALLSGSPPARPAKHERGSFASRALA